MITFRREYLDTELEALLPTMAGRVLDVGGRKSNKRGRFRPPLGQVSSWKYANPDASAEPDFLAGAESIPATDSSFDLIVMTEVLEYVSNPAAALTEMNRLLVQGGRLILSVPLQCPVHGDAEQDFFRFTRAGTALLLSRAGFRNFSISEMGGLGAILFDALEAATGYAHPGQRKLSVKISRKLLYFAEPLFWLVEKIFRKQRSSLTTGYFVVATK